MKRCKDCGNTYRKELPICPNCGSKQVIEEEKLEPKNCPKCETTMRRGFMVEANAPLQIMTLGEGIYWSPDETGLLHKRVAIRAYACPYCGYVEHYIRHLKGDREIILKAPE